RGRVRRASQVHPRRREALSTASARAARLRRRTATGCGGCSEPAPPGSARRSRGSVQNSRGVYCPPVEQRRDERRGRAMLFRRFYDDNLAQASYMIACEKTREAIVVDPNVDVGMYTRAAGADRVRIVHVTETHIHADFVSGARALAVATGARLHLSGEGNGDWTYSGDALAGADVLRNGSVVEFGRVRLCAVHTPGHTPEHLTFLVSDLERGEEPVGALTGDFIFVGDVGRPDLLEK